MKPSDTNGITQGTDGLSTKPGEGTTILGNAREVPL